MRPQITAYKIRKKYGYNIKQLKAFRRLKLGVSFMAHAQSIHEPIQCVKIHACSVLPFGSFKQ